METKLAISLMLAIILVLPVAIAQGAYASNSIALNQRQASNYYSAGQGVQFQYYQPQYGQQTVLVVSGDAQRIYRNSNYQYGYWQPTPYPTPFPTPAPTATPALQPTSTPKPKCVDGTPMGECSVNKPNFCNANRLLVARASACGCPSGNTRSGEQCIAPSPTPSPTPFFRPTPTPFITPTPTAFPIPTLAPAPEPDRVSRLFYFQVSTAGGFQQRYFAAQKGDVINFRLSTDNTSLGHSLTIKEYGINFLISSTNISEPNNVLFFLNKSGTFSVTCGYCNPLNYPNGLANFIGTLQVN